MANQWIRKANLIVSSGTNGLDLSELRFKFQVKASDVSTPNVLWVRIYNVKRDTAESLRKREFTNITLQAGYENGNFGIIFSGEIKQVAIGRERNVDSYVDLWGGDGDEWYAWAVTYMAAKSGETPQQVIESIVKSTSKNGIKPLPFASDVTGLIEGAGLGVREALRGRTGFGMSRDYCRDWALKYGFRWSIQGGEFVIVPQTGYRPGTAVELSSSSGLIGTPEAQNGGVKVRALLNPKIRIGCLIHIQQDDINRIVMQKNGLRYDAAASAVITTAEGFYRVLVCDVIGDTRGVEWYSDLTCLAVDVTAPDQMKSVAAAG